MPSLAAGQQLGPYRIVSLLGAGGMGEVWEARDERLNRSVAIKISKEEFSERFQREAQAVAALNHPHICTLYDIGPNYLVFERVQGIPLQGPLPMETALQYAVQILDALDAAHRRGIIHRDLKPSNILVNEHGIKLLDFGLAKQSHETGENTATLSRALTAHGQIVGTLQYMSPEQLHGKAADERSDLFSFGCVLYEMLLGSRAFDGANQASIIAAILEREPAERTTSSPLDGVIRRCLAKDPEKRFQTARDVKAALAWAVEQPFTVAGGPSRRSTFITVAAGCALGAAVGLAIYVYLSRKEVPAPVNRTFTQLTNTPGFKYSPALSPDGKTFAYAAAGDIFIQRVGGSNPTNLTFDSPAIDTDPAFSRDGTRIAFSSSRDGGGIFIMGATGENLKRVAAAGFHPAWSPDGHRVVFSTASQESAQFNQSRLNIVDLDSGKLSSIGPENALQPSWSPNGHRIAYFGSRAEGGSTDIWTVPAGGGESVPVTSDDSFEMSPSWSSDGRWLYYSSDRAGSTNLWRIRIDERSGHASGRPEQITTPSTFSFMPSLSRDGHAMVYLQQTRTSNIHVLEFDPVSEKGTAVKAVTQGARLAWTPDVSPDGTWLAWCSRGSDDIVLARTDGTGFRRLTDDEFSDRAPRWSPGGERIAFYSTRTGKRQIWTIRPDGSGLTQVSDSQTPVLYTVWSPDGQRIATGAGNEIHVFDMTGTGVQSPVQRIQTPKGERAIPWAWSRDGKTLAVGLQSGFHHDGIFLYSFETGRFEQLTSFGWGAIWLNDSRRLLFTDEKAIHLIDRFSRKSKVVHSVAPYGLGWELTLSKDNRRIFFNLDIRESDVWLMTQ